MFIVDTTTKTMHLTRGDIAIINITAKAQDGSAYTFLPGDEVRLRVFKKKSCGTVVMSKSVVVLEEGQSVVMTLTSTETRFGEVISKPVDYWYEIELNPDTNPQTIIGYDKAGEKIFRLYPEGGE